VTVHGVIVSLAKNFPEPTTKRPWIQPSRARQNSAAEAFYFTRKQPWLGSERTEMKFKEIPIDVFQDVEKPGLDPAGIHRADNVKDSYRQVTPQRLCFSGTD
jgi:hypothetical protein